MFRDASHTGVFKKALELYYVNEQLERVDNTD